MMLKLPPLTLYIHFPWCREKCFYCDFNAHKVKSTIPSKSYLKKLIKDIDYNKKAIGRRKFSSVFLGGGTPSLFPARTIGVVLEYLEKNDFLERKNLEVTIEVNPEDVNSNTFFEYKDIGINRISLGVQSFQDDKLYSLGRNHSKATIVYALKCLEKSNFENINIDLMYGLMRQTVKDALSDIKHALSFNITHISWYELSIEPLTKFFTNKPLLPEEKILEKIEMEGRCYLRDSNYKRYEISSYSKNILYRSQHNLNYWKFGDYIGIGAGSHSKLTNPESHKIVRFWNKKNPYLYLSNQSEPYGEKTIEKKELPYEFMLNRLRLIDGFSSDIFQRSTGIPFSTIQRKIDEAIERKFLFKEDAYYYTTDLGKRFLNEIVKLFM